MTIKVVCSPYRHASLVSAAKKKVKLGCLFWELRSLRNKDGLHKGRA